MLPATRVLERFEYLCMQFLQSLSMRHVEVVQLRHVRQLVVMHIRRRQDLDLIGQGAFPARKKEIQRDPVLLILGALLLNLMPQF